MKEEVHHKDRGLGEVFSSSFAWRVGGPYLGYDRIAFSARATFFSTPILTLSMAWRLQLSPEKLAWGSQACTGSNLDTTAGLVSEASMAAMRNSSSLLKNGKRPKTKLNHKKNGEEKKGSERGRKGERQILAGKDI